MINTRSICFTWLLLMVLAPGVPAQRSQKAQVVTDTTHGYRITVPAEWTSLPIHIDATRLVGWFESKRHYSGDSKKGDPPGSRPARLCIVRLDKPVEGKSVHDYGHRLGRMLKKDSYRTFSIDIEHEAMNIVQWDVQVGGEGVDRWRSRAWVFSGPNYDLAVEFSVRTDHFPELEPVFMRSLRSVRLIESKPLPKLAPVLRKPFVLRRWLAIPLLERHRQRAAIGAAHEKRVLSKLPAGWTVHEGRDILLLSHCDQKTTKRVLEWIEAFYGWLHDRFGKLSTEYPIRTTIRLCANETEYNAYRRSGGWRVDYNFADREVIMCDDHGNLNMKDVLWRVFRRYMLDIAPEVYFNLPVWLRQGLKGLISRAYMRRRKLVFPSASDELGIYNNLRRTKRAKIWTVVDLMNDPHFGYVPPDKSPIDDDLRVQARVLLRFFDGPGKRCKAVPKDFLLQYCVAIRKLVRELDFKNPNVMVWDTEDVVLARLEQLRDAKTDPAERQARIDVPKYRTRWTNYLKLVRQRQSTFLTVLHARTCSWSKAEWTQVERAYEIFYKSKSR